MINLSDFGSSNSKKEKKKLIDRIEKMTKNSKTDKKDDFFRLDTDEDQIIIKKSKK